MDMHNSNTGAPSKANSSQLNEVGQLSLNIKKVAMRLSGVSATDRNWILQQLESVQRQQVTHAYEQLKQLRGNNMLDFSLFLDDDEIQAGDRPLEQSTPAKPSHAQPHTINQLPLKLIADLLAQLPLSYVNALLQNNTWESAQRYRAQLTKEQKIKLSNVNNTVSVRVSESIASALVAIAADEVGNESKG